MYKINLYPEYRQHRRSTRARAASTAVFISLLGLEALLVGALVLSGSLLGEQVDTMREDLSRLEERLQRVTLDRPELSIALDMLEVRQARIDWSPKFVSLAEHVGQELALKELKGRAFTRREPASFTISGQYRDKAASLDIVSAFLNRLRVDQRMYGDFPTISLGNIRSDGRGEFDLLCTTTEVSD